jgi:hypothetical protein
VKITTEVHCFGFTFEPSVDLFLKFFSVKDPNYFQFQMNNVAIFNYLELIMGYQQYKKGFCNKTPVFQARI